MKTIGERIKERREQLRLSQEELALKLGYKSRSTINKIEMDSRNLKHSKIKAIADALETTPSYIMGWEEPESKEKHFDNIFPIQTKKFPLLGEIACGEPIFANEDRESYIEAGTDIRADFCLKCKGDSMIDAGILSGDKVIVRPQPSAEHGEIVVALFEDEATVKRLSLKDGQVWLLPENPAYLPIDGREARIIGKVCAVYREYGR